jgi:16S rRNA (cytidine1402-2'-O)-methyltransferase
MPLAVCATPIGNLEDVTLRVLAELREADTILCEDTRHTAVLLGRYEIAGGGRLVSYHEHNEAARTAELLPRLAAGERLALVSDAGLPAVNDPGGRLVAAALDRGVPVTVLPGPSAVETALVASGLVDEQYRFVGFLPRREAERSALWEHLRTQPYPTVAFESPSRLPASLESLARVLPERRLAVCRELTKRFEEVIRGTAQALASEVADLRGEVTIVIARADGDPEPETGLSAAVSAVNELVGAGVSRKHACRVVASLTGHAQNGLYRASL